MPVSADLVRLAWVREATPGTTPAAPVFTSARMTSESLAFAPITAVSGELNPSGQVTDSILTGGASTGSVDFEVSDSAFFEDMLETVFGGQWTANVLIPDTTLYTYTVEKTFPDIPIPGDESYHRFVSSSFVDTSITITPGSPITGTTTILGGELSLDTAIIAGATYPGAGTEPVLVPSDVVVVFSDWAATSCFSALTMDFTCNLRGIACIGTLGTKETIRGRFECTVSASVYFSNDEGLQDLIDQTEFPVSVTLNDSLGAPEYTFEFPRCKLTQCTVAASGGTGSDVIAEMAVQALYDEVLGYSCKVTRAA